MQHTETWQGDIDGIVRAEATILFPGRPGRVRGKGEATQNTLQCDNHTRDQQGLLTVHCHAYRPATRAAQSRLGFEARNTTEAGIDQHRRNE